LHNRELERLTNETADTDKPLPQPKNRETEEIEAESISYAVCAYYGIQTGENSFGYLATWSKDKELSALRASLETINKTSSGLITDIDRNYAAIMKERGLDKVEQAAEQSALSPEQTQITEAFEAANLYYDADPNRLSFSGRGVDGAEYAFDSWKDAAEWIDSAPFQNAEINHAIKRVLHPEQFTEQETKAPTYPMPDPTLTALDMHSYGYTDVDMLPLTRERAIELYQRDLPVYMLYNDNTEAMALDTDEIITFDGMFGISRGDWELEREYLELTAGHELTDKELENSFLNNPADAFAIYQLKHTEDTRDLRFAPLETITAAGLTVAHDNYELVYTGELPKSGGTDSKLNDQFYQFNQNHPEDFRGHSLSVSDIVALKQAGDVSCHYVDSWGFKEQPAFLKPENYLKNAEMAMEDDYGMIDGIVNNGVKQPAVAELEQQAKSGTPISLMDLAEAVHRERGDDRKEKRPSVLAQLKSYQSKEKSNTAPKKSAEREL
ncbi:MAG: DUF4316 domain-containing protein, partial [Gammaproteobacteria bacterium]|nr:DUF4316 domain-containing protein [Gammaproteobacteria bacterium]